MADGPAGAYTEQVPGSSGGGRKGRHPKHQAQHEALRSALSGLAGGLAGQGFSKSDAKHYARLILAQPGITLGRAGNILFKGKRYTPEAFAGSPIAKYVTGKKAEEQNQATILSDPNYLSALASLTSSRDTALADYEAQRRRALLDFGDPAFAGSDSLLAGEAAANPNSMSKLLALAYARAQNDTRNQANRAGTLFGGGLKSGLAEAGRVNAANQQGATQDLTDLLANLGRESAQARNAYDTGLSSALQSTTQNLLQSGVIHAATAPHLAPATFGSFSFWNTKKRKAKNPGGELLTTYG